MKMRYVVDVEMKRGYSPMTERRVETAVWDAAPTPGSIRSLSATAGRVEEVVCGEGGLYGFAERKKGRIVIWLFDSTRIGVETNLELARTGKLRGFRKNGDYIAVRFNFKTSAWEPLTI